MCKFYSLILFFFISFSAGALVIPKGTFYFDNSKTKYNVVKFVYGSDSRNETYVVSMTLDEGDRWKVSFSEKEEDMYRYTFAATALPDGKIENTFSNVKEAISKTYNEYRTATTDAAILVGGIFVPSSGDNWAQGSWQTVSGSATYSGTLPVMFIETENRAEIISKEDYINATYYIDNMGMDEYEAIGTKDAPFPLEIRGRGNYTWTGFDKKPYRIKLGSKAKLLGMKKSKHFALLAHADDRLGFLRNEVGFELSRRMGMTWTPATAPIEVVLNGDYIGLYFLTETIRVDEDRVNIVEQADEETDSYSITGGWLMEIDNYEEELQVRITEGNGAAIRFTYKTPELLSDAQKDYLTTQVNAMDDAIYAPNKSSTEWEQLIDMETLAGFYVVQEVMDNTESFHGSCYLHKDIGEETKWKFGPVWDFGCTFYSSRQEFIYENPPYGQTWIGEIAKFPRFQAKVSEIWKWFKGNKCIGLNEFIDDFIDRISIASQYNYMRWNAYGNGDIEYAGNEFKNKLTARLDWLVEQWGEGVSSVDQVTSETDFSVSYQSGVMTVASSETIETIALYDLTGRIITRLSPHSARCELNCSSGIYMVTAETDDNVIRRKVVVR